MTRTVQAVAFDWIVSPGPPALTAGEGEDRTSRQ